MLRYIVAALCGVSLTGSVYMAGWGSHSAQDAEECCVVTSESPAAIQLPDGVVDIKNPKCIVEDEDIESSTKFVTYQNKAFYRICCNDCVKKFNADPEKYVKAFEADPAKFGVKK